MPHICYCSDAPDSMEKRQQTMAAHLAYIDGIMDEVLVAGPLRDAPDDAPVGSCFIYRSEDREFALQLLHNDPYFKAGVWQQVECQHFKAVGGKWIGGASW